MYVEECDDLSKSDVKQFRENCKMFWIAAAEYAIKKLPFNDKLLSSVLDVASKARFGIRR